MKVVLFCGGLGMRIREAGENVPKPMVTIGYRPILWHVMKYYAHYGHKDFILCLGYRGDVIKQYFLDYDECLSNDFTLSEGGRAVELSSSVSVRPSQTFHVVSMAADGVVQDIRHIGQGDVWVNGGFFAFKREIFDYIKAGE